MSSEESVIDQLFILLGKESDRCRDNISHIYLSQFGKNIIPFCRNHFHSCKNPSARIDFLRWVIEYAKESDEVVDFAIEALEDRSKKVRRYACLVLACSESERSIPTLARIVSEGKEPTSIDARNAITAIQNKNWYLFHQTDRQDRQYVLPMPHKTDYPETADVDYYIRKMCPNSVPELERILGNIYSKWQPQGA